MPSASTKVEITASSEALEPIKKVLTVVDKKVRNLEKRKLKLDAYKEKQDSGQDLQPDQQIAVDRYGEVVQNLEFARDLQKQFTAINADTEKLLKKQAKRGKSEKVVQEVKRVREVLQIQGILDSMGSDNVRKDFQSGKHGAIVLTEDNLEQLDELYKCISPTRDGDTNYHESLSTASDHIVSLLDAKDKPIVGTTYKELKELLDLISGCGYFEKAPYVESGKEETAGEVEFEVVEHQDVPSPDSEEVQSSLPPEVKEEPKVMEETSTTLNTQTQVPNIAAEADSFFSGSVNTQQTVEQQQQAAQQAAAAAAAFNRQRPFQEIVSSVQGSFNFLQESTIESETATREFSPHMDPAVVAAHPMPTAPQSMVRTPSTQNPEAQFGAPAYGEPSPLDTDHTGSHVTSHTIASVDQSLLSQKNQSSISTQDFTNSGFAQTNLSLQTDNLFSGSVSSTDKNSGSLQHSVDSSVISQFEIPPIPMPPGHDQSQDQSANEKKSYQMNPNASEFQSHVYTSQEEENLHDKSNTDSNNFQGGSYSSNNYSGGRDQRGGRGGGYRNDRNDRGGNRGNSRGGMSNGFSRGGGGRNSQGGGYERSNSGGGGNSNYQGYPPRNDYRPDGYQGYSNNKFGGSGGGNTGGFQGRGGSGAPRGGSRGGPRGGSNYNRGGSGGGYRGNSSNRGGQGGFGRANFNQQQTSSN